MPYCSGCKTDATQLVDGVYCQNCYSMKQLEDNDRVPGKMFEAPVKNIDDAIEKVVKGVYQEINTLNEFLFEYFPEDIRSMNESTIDVAMRLLLDYRNMLVLKKLEEEEKLECQNQQDAEL